jgi:hypothetical protein
VEKLHLPSLWQTDHEYDSSIHISKKKNRLLNYFLHTQFRLRVILQIDFGFFKLYCRCSSVCNTEKPTSVPTFLVP